MPSFINPPRASALLTGALLLVLTVLVSTVWVPTILASEEISQAEGLDCVACHTEPGSEVLTDRGKFYELMGSFDGFEEITAAFEECTACHVSHPGSKELTERGEKFAFVVADMEGLLQWVRSEHPGWPEVTAEVTEAGKRTEAEKGAGGGAEEE